MNRSTQPHATAPTACPACRSYTAAERSAIADAGRAHWRQLAAIREQERSGPVDPPFRRWDEVDAMTWRPA
jgi:hypothetical protein